MKKAPYHQVTAKDIEMVHALKDAGLNANKVAKITGRSPNTIKYMFQAKDLASYREQMTKNYLKYAPTKAEEPKDGEVKPQQDKVKALYDGDIRALASQLNSIIALLKNIENKLPGQVQKKRWF